VARGHPDRQRVAMYKPFPVAAHDDFFDAVSRICDEELGATWPSASLSAQKCGQLPARKG
jgi:hypothetical protein